MRVMIIGPTTYDHFAENVASTLRGAGHIVTMAGPARRVGGPRRLRNAQSVIATYVRSVDEAWQRHLVATANRFRPDLVLTVDIGLRPRTVADLRVAPDTRVALWFPDHVTNLGNHEALLAPYDRVYVKNPVLAAQLHDLHGLPVGYLPEAANPDRHRPLCDYGTERTFVMAGNIHPTRATLLQRLVQAGIPLTLYGPAMSSWLEFPALRSRHSGRSVVGEEKARVFRSALGVINNLHPAEFAGANCRLFEAASCGAAVLTEWRPGMEDLFDRSSEVLPFATFEDMLKLCRSLLLDPSAGLTVGDAAARRARSDHTYAQRLDAVFADLGLACE